ncbi:MAG: hypothetical protein JW745_09520 [Sedimentisphaerales bacterium]|nr:hypothetical protein [Sedimentisphaerales bacterium]MBN2842415.1 hypothetical protein [Sedimentisphaerales bacterium]
MKIIKFISVTISLMLLVAGCGSAGKCPAYTDDQVVSVSFGNMRVKTDLPQNWVKIRETIGTVHVLIYTVLASEQPSAQNDAQAFFKAQGCDARMELDMYKDYVLFGKEFTPESGNVMLASERVNDNYWLVKWQGKGPDHDYIIWDIIGVKDEVALHIRLTCPMVDNYQPFADRLQCDLDQIFKTLEIVLPTEGAIPPADTVSENA